ncbi:hypothetical protein EJ110_NYTH45207 [Nymphaea thermarum]|nr:hypothetical protein EJ110_NYTH45207 [Nymphaea thermarum]
MKKDKSYVKPLADDFTTRIPFNIVNLPSFQATVDVVGQFDEFVKVYKEHWKMHGCSIMLDEWTDTRGRSLINFLVHCPIGKMFLKLTDAPDKVNDAYMLFKLLRDVIKEVGEENIVQIVIHCASNYVKATKMLMCEPDLEHLCWTSCTAHCLDMMLKGIGEIPNFKSIFTKKRELVLFIYAHGEALNMMRSHIQRDLHRPVVARFATQFNFRQMQKDSMNEVHNFLKVVHSLVEVLYMVDSDERPSMRYIYEATSHAKEKIKVNLKNEKSSYQPIWDIINKRWDDQLH